MKFVLIISGCFLIVSAYAQQIEMKGQYNGENLYVLNSTSNDGAICVTEITVNGIKTDDEINSSSFEIYLSHLNLKVGEPVKIILFHKAGCTPMIINPEAVKLKNNFNFRFINVNRKGLLQWELEGEAGDDPFYIQQYRWNKWVNVGEVKREDSVSFNAYSFEITPHYGQNLFRVVQTDERGNTVFSSEGKYRTIVKEIFLVSGKVKNDLEFTSETLYEIFTYEGEFIRSGTDSSVDVSSLATGEYWVNYDNKTEIFVKK